MVNTSPRWTADDLDWIADDECRYEVVDGELFVTPSPSRAHQSVAGQLYARLFEFVRQHRIGSVFFAPADVHVDARNRVQPDIFVEPPAPVALAGGWRDAPTPILVVEILSATTSPRDLGPKRALYLRSGMTEYWIVDPADRNVRVVRRGQADAVERERVEWLPDDAPAPLVIDLPSLFREALDR